MKDYYYLLGLKQTATLDDIKNSYRRLSKKFHPDVNDGDSFFAERFKDIQEAYEVLINTEKRKVYDLKYTNKPQQSFSNFSPEIEFFTSDKSGIHIGDDITFKWKTINADVVLLEPLGPVKPIGEITYKIKNVKVNKISFKLVAVNSNIDRKTEKEVIVKNLTYDEIYKEAYDDIKREINSNSYSKKSEPIFDSINNNEQQLDVPESFEIFGKFIMLLVVGITAIWFIIASFTGKPW
jgi:curved DNA-binding protein CbpA